MRASVLVVLCYCGVRTQPVSSLFGEYVTVTEAARRTDRQPELIRRWIREKRIPAVKIGRDLFVAEADLAMIEAMPRRKRG